MRKVILAVLAALLLSGTAETQDLIRYYPPQLTSSGTALTSTVPILLPAGTAAAPSLALADDADGTGTGIYRYVQNSLGFSTNGALRWYITSGGFFAPNTNVAQDIGEAANQIRTLYHGSASQGSTSKSLTDAAAAVSFVRIAVATNGYIGGQVIYTANSTDGTNRLTTTNTCRFAAADTAGTVTCGAIACDATPATAYRRANTLVCTVTAATSTTNCDLQVTCTDNLAGDQTPIFEWRLDMPATATVTPQ